MLSFRVGLLLVLLLPCSLHATGKMAEPIRVGVLYSSTGTMAISETHLRDALLVMIDQQNERGGLLGRPLEALVIDPASNWPLYAEKARQLIEREHVAVIFGCWTSASRKAVKPVVEELNGLLFYPVQYEGREQSDNIFYLGAAPNQQALPAVRFLMETMEIERWVLAGTDYVYPRATNRLLSAFLLQNGVTAPDIMISYTPFGHDDWERIVSDIRRFAAEGKKTAIVSTINGDANIAFYRELARQGVSADDIPVIAFSVGEGELSMMDAKPLTGHLAAWNYFMSIDNPANRAFISDLQRQSGGQVQVVNDPIEAQYIGFQLWLSAVASAGSTDTDKVRQAMIGLSGKNLSGGEAEMLPNHHISKPAYIGRLRPDGQYEIIWKSAADIPGDPWIDPVSVDADKGH
jgi:urea transport system substrate-binding protein